MSLATAFRTLATAYVVLSGYNRDDRSCLIGPPAQNQPQPRPFTVHVEGSVGCGKSTFLEFFEGFVGVMVEPEPIEEWRDVNGTDLLEMAIVDGRRWSGLFQMQTTLSRLKAAAKKPLDGKGNPAGVRIAERSVFSGRYCFLELYGRTGVVSEPEFALMDEWFRFVVEEFGDQVRPDVIVYLRCDVETLLERIKKRGRPEEANTSAAFLEGLNRAHDDWLLGGSFPVPSRVVVINPTGSVEETRVEIAKRLHQMLPEELLPLRKYQ